MGVGGTVEKWYNRFAAGLRASPVTQTAAKSLLYGQITKNKPSFYKHNINTGCQQLTTDTGWKGLVELEVNGGCQEIGHGSGCTGWPPYIVLFFYDPFTRVRGNWCKKICPGWRLWLCNLNFLHLRELCFADHTVSKYLAKTTCLIQWFATLSSCRVSIGVTRRALE